MRLFLDLQVSGRAFAPPLRRDGHDVMVGVGDPRFEAMRDAELLRVATADARIVVTFDVDFARITHRWAHEGDEHAGVILLLGMRSDAYGPALRSIRAALARHPRQEQWRNLIVLVGRSAG